MIYKTIPLQFGHSVYVCMHVCLYLDVYTVHVCFGLAEMHIIAKMK